MVDLAIGIGLPVLEMILQYIVQGHRYDIYEDIGCVPFTYNTGLAIVLVYLPPILIGLTSAVYCISSIRAFNRSRLQFKEILSNNTNLKAGRFLRLMLLAGVDLACTVPLGCFALYLSVSLGLVPWISWANVHDGFSEVDQYPAIIWKASLFESSMMELNRWLVIVCAFIFFGFFGFSEEARKNYRSAFGSVSKRVGYTGSGSGVFSFNSSKSKTGMSTTDTSGSLPVYVRSEVLRKKNSLDSFSDMSVGLNDVGGALKSEKDSDGQDEKGCMPAPAYESIQLPDLGGVLADYDPRSSSPLSSGSSSSGVRSSIEPPQPAHIRPPSSMIEISSLRCISYFDSNVLPEASFVAPRHPIDTPSSVPRGSIDIV
jgi:pheromone a factor receptor